MQPGKKICIWFLVFFMSAVFLLTGLFLANYMHHQCSGSDCPICADITECLLLMENSAPSLKPTPPAAADSSPLFHILPCIFLSSFLFPPITLVTLSTKLSD